ncbi:MAG: glycosyltransferase family 25 protein [Thiobacillus sp.]|nr:glycosyltransferase family 25 protein [Thiobacillus sp.]
MKRVGYYCINLVSAEDRKASIQMLARQAAIDIEFVVAVEGASLDIASVASYDRRKRMRYMEDMEPNEIACSLSHRRALQSFLAGASPFGVILEDDAVFSPTIDSDIGRILDSARGFDLLKLESRDDRGIRVKGGEEFHLFLPLKASNGATAILYTRDGARKVLESLNNFIYPFDTHLGFGWRLSLVCIACWPPLVKENSALQSTISGRKKSKRRKGFRCWLLARSERIGHSIMKRFYYLKVKYRITRRRDHEYL